MTRNVFAHWSFERDQEVGLYERTMTFEKLPKDEQESYFEEADYYLTLPQADWPCDILERL